MDGWTDGWTAGVRRLWTAPIVVLEIGRFEPSHRVDDLDRESSLLGVISGCRPPPCCPHELVDGFPRTSPSCVRHVRCGGSTTGCRSPCVPPEGKGCASGQPTSQPGGLMVSCGVAIDPYRPHGLGPPTSLPLPILRLAPSPLDCRLSFSHGRCFVNAPCGFGFLPLSLCSAGSLAAVFRILLSLFRCFCCPCLALNMPTASRCSPPVEPPSHVLTSLPNRLPVRLR